MLFLNNELFKLPDTLETELRGELRSGKTLKFPKELKSTTVDNEGNVVVEYPVTRSIPYTDSVDLDMETFKPASKDTKKPKFCKVRYCETVGGTRDRPEYKPAGRTNLVTLYEENAEEYWFLKYCSRFIKNGLNAKANRNKNYSCVIDNPVEDEQAQVAKEAILFKVGNLIYDNANSGGLPEDKLRNIAAAFGVSDSLKGRIDGVKIKLKRAVEVDEIKATASGDPGLKGYKYFIKLATEDYDFSLRANISKGIELGIIEYVSARKAWFFLGDTKQGEPRKYEENIVKCEPTVDSKENFLINFLERTPDIKVRFDQKLKEKLDGGSDSEGDYENLKSLKIKYEEAGDTDKLIEVVEKMLVIKPKNQALKGELNKLKILQTT